MSVNPMTITHIACVALIVVCSTALGVAGGVSSSDATNIYVACLGSLSGHAVGYAAAISSEQRRKDD